MKFNEKLQELRKQNGLTQEELAQKLYVSRAAVSKWESGRGYPNIDSLKAIAHLFSITVDQLLSSDELLNLAEENNNQITIRMRDLFFGLLDITTISLFFLPLFAQRGNCIIHEVSLLNLREFSPYIKLIYVILVVLIVAFGVLMLALQNCNNCICNKAKYAISIILNIFCAIIFNLGLHPYASTFLFAFLIIKFIILIKKY